MDARTRLLRSAARLFYKHGIHAVGIERVISEAGTAKSVFYYHFPSKHALICAFLKQRDEQWMAWMRGRVEALASDPAERVLGVFTALGEWFAEKDFRGCAFLNAAIEMPGGKLHAIIEGHIEDVKQLFRDLLAEAGRPASEAIVEQLFLLAEGAIVTAQAGLLRDPAAVAAHLARALLAKDPAAVHAAAPPRPSRRQRPGPRRTAARTPAQKSTFAG